MFDDMKLSSNLLDTAPHFTRGSKQPLAGEAEVVIVGAGLTGCSAALALANKGAKVLVCEPDTEPFSTDLLDRLLPRRRNTVDTKNLVNYFRTTPDNRLLFGGRARFAVCIPKSDTKSGAILREALGEVFPEINDARIDYCWGGMVDMARDRLPRAGERNGIYFSMGYSGHGTQMSTYMGQLMADVMVGRPEAKPWRGFAWPAIPDPFGKPWFLPLVGAYYQLRDRLA